MWPSVSRKPASARKKFLWLLGSTIAFVTVIALLIAVPAADKIACDRARHEGLPAPPHRYSDASAPEWDARKSAAQTMVRCGTYTGISIEALERELGKPLWNERYASGKRRAIAYDLGLDSFGLDGVILVFDYDVRSHKVLKTSINGHGYS